MSVGGEPGHLHPIATQRSSFRYFFYDKHHGRGRPEAAQWSPNLSDDEEFAIFDQADLLDLSDEHENLYGISVVQSLTGKCDTWALFTSRSPNFRLHMRVPRGTDFLWDRSRGTTIHHIRRGGRFRNALSKMVARGLTPSESDC